MNIRLTSTLLIFSILKISAYGQIEEFSQEIKKFKEYEISKALIRENWTSIKVGFNNTFDTIDLEESPLAIGEFKSEFAKLLLSVKSTDTAVVYFDYKEHIDLEKMINSRNLIVGELSKSNTGKFYFATYIRPSPIGTADQDSLYLKQNRQISINSQKLEYAALKTFLQQRKTKSILLFAEKDVPIQDLVEILDIAKDLNIKIMLNTK